MPKPLKKHDAEPLEPYEEVAFHLKDGQSVQLQIFRDTDTGVELVQCDLCGLYFTLTTQRLPPHLKNNRGLIKCQKEMERNVKRLHAAEAIAAHEALFGSPSQALGASEP